MEEQNEREYLLYVELPNLINRIMKLDSIPIVNLRTVELTAKEIKRVSITETESALETLRILCSK